MRAMVIATILYSTVFAVEYHVDAVNGSDAYPGTREQPFAALQQAAQVMVAGDVCWVHEGIYREQVRPSNSGTSGQPIRFEAWNNETVYITGTETVRASEWQVFQSGIYYVDLPTTAQVTQLFCNWQQMEIARFPNNESNNLLTPTLGVAKSALAQQQPALSEISDPRLSAAPDLTGGQLWLLSGVKWISFTMPISTHQGDKIQFVFAGKANDIYGPRAGSDYFITGLLSLLDAEGEWFFDSKARRLYFYPPFGVPQDVEIRTRQYGASMINRSYIEFKNIHFFGANLNLELADNCIIENARILYPVPFFPTDGWAHTETPQNSQGAGVRLGGRGNTLRHSEIAYSWGDGVTVFGEGNTVENCLIHDFAWVCNDAAGVHTGGKNHKILNNSIYNGSRSGVVHRKSMGLEIAYNDIYNCGLLCTDLGATYCWQTDGGGTVIHHNWVHDVVTTGHTAGIYLDNGSGNFIVHHNVVWNTDDLGIQTNLDAINHQIYHNTLWNCGQAMGGGGGQIHENCQVYNNLANAPGWFGTDVQQNLVLNDALFVDERHGDFRLRADSPARDDYLPAATFVNGGFESGTGGWNGAGCSLESITEPVHSGNRACRSYHRNKYWEGVRQDVTEVLKDHGPGSYTIEAWVMPAAGTVDGYLRFFIEDAAGRNYPGTTRRLSPTAWTKITYKTTLNWTGELKQAVFELMTTDADKALPDLYIDDCALITPPPKPDSTRQAGAVLLSGFQDDVTDGKPDAGAYEYGGKNADWKAGSSLTPFATRIKAPDKLGYLPQRFTLAQNFPNPFNGSTTIRYELARATNVRLKIYNVLGVEVMTLEGNGGIGEHSVAWDGRSADGSTVGSGIYLYRLWNDRGEPLSESRKMVYIR